MSDLRSGRRTATLSVTLMIPLALAAATHAGGSCAADLDNDGVVGAGDLAILLGAWGPAPGDPADLTGDDVVGPDDLAVLLGAWDASCGDFVVDDDLLGRPLPAFPFFQYERAHLRGRPLYLGLDPAAHPELIDAEVDVYVVFSKDASGWDADPALTDVTDAVDTVTFVAGGVQDNTVMVDDGGLSGAGGINVGVAYDLVIDVNRNGVLDGGDLIDGYGDEAGVTIYASLATSGPYDTEDVDYSGGSFLGQRLYWPSNIAELGPRPLVVISHGNGHQFTWYDWLQSHLASYGFIVMSHQNNTVPGVQSASLTTLSNTDYFLGNLDTIAGGALEGLVDSNTIIWIGHSRGGEGVVRAYDRIRDGTSVPDHFTLSDIRLISSIAPTDFLGTSNSSPGTVDYHLIYGAADGDVSGTPDSDIAQSFILFERANDWRASTYLHGADHNDFNCCGFNDFQGPANTQLGRPAAQALAKTYYLALIRFRIEGDGPISDFLWRQHEDLRPIGTVPSAVVVLDYRDARDPDLFVIDNYQTNSEISVSSSGGAVITDVENPLEGSLNDNNNSFVYLSSDPFNGMTRARSSDASRGAVFGWTEPRSMRFLVLEDEQDFSDDRYLQFRANQLTRHPDTTFELGDLTFDVTLVDGDGVESTINIGVYDGGVEEPYQRTGEGAGAGWQNEIEVVRIRLADFTRNGTPLNLADIAEVRFDFGGPGASTRGRIGFDELRLSKE